MNRHPFRWEAFLFGLAFLAVVGTWLSRAIGLVSPDQWAYVIAGGLIALGVAGIIASVAKPDRPAGPPVADVSEPSDDEPQPPSTSNH